LTELYITINTMNKISISKKRRRNNSRIS